eukprot:1144105-Pelagomonas_calceolata.AAC.3
MHKRHKLGSADASGYYYNSWQRLNHAIQPTPPTTTVISEADNPPSQLANNESAIPSGRFRSSLSACRASLNLNFVVECSYGLCTNANKLVTTWHAIHNNNTSRSQVIEPGASNNLMEVEPPRSPLEPSFCSFEVEGIQGPLGRGGKRCPVSVGGSFLNARGRMASREFPLLT